jgi:capsular polysaccharide transport system permease protein
MTTTPKASRFRLGLNRAQKPSAAPANPKPEPQPPAEPAAAEEYSARQLRIARRVAKKNGIKFSNDLDAIAKLKNAGIDPFDRGTIMNMVTPERSEQQTQKAQLPQRIEPVQVPAEQKQSGEVSPVQQRETEIHQIQRDMIRRRRRNTFILTLRLLAFVFLPTAFVSYY